MRIYRSLILIVIFLISCNSNNKKQNFNSKQNSSINNEMQELIKILNKDSNQHQDIGSKLTDSEIKEIELQIGLTLPNSYKIFLTQFGNGANWLYMNPIDDLKRFSYLRKFRKKLGKTVELVGEKEIDVDSLLCLMTEDSNGGAWCWLTTENTSGGEWPLAYFSMDDNKLHYKVEGFTEWLRLLTKSKYEVIRELDTEDELGLG